jgi:hypothetical protein
VVPTSWGGPVARHAKLMTAFASAPPGSKLPAVEKAVRAGKKGHILVVRDLKACQHVLRMDVEIAGGRV